ncbi:hypothetical protein G6F63_016028 [Rhizopus arrhizus]|nr:hypothetical protein G6F35_017613 [Rhizopus arrhizus]KAG1316536.1 hypothetical protein G6F63_016028 [Rhizopus arrhizus]KAG1374337.1 hypothetical protein G6F60_015508 [Rhizopus arrhizus]
MADQHARAQHAHFRRPHRAAFQCDGAVVDQHEVGAGGGGGAPGGTVAHADHAHGVVERGYVQVGQAQLGQQQRLDARIVEVVLHRIRADALRATA